MVLVAETNAGGFSICCGTRFRLLPCSHADQPPLSLAPGTPDSADWREKPKVARSRGQACPLRTPRRPSRPSLHVQAGSRSLRRTNNQRTSAPRIRRPGAQSNACAEQVTTKTLRVKLFSLLDVHHMFIVFYRLDEICLFRKIEPFWCRDFASELAGDIASAGWNKPVGE